MYQHVGIVKVLLEGDFQSEAEKVDCIYQRHLYGTSPLDSARAHNQEIFQLMAPYRRDDRERIQEITEEAPIEGLSLSRSLSFSFSFSGLALNFLASIRLLLQSDRPRLVPMLPSLFFTCCGISLRWVKSCLRK